MDRNPYLRRTYNDALFPPTLANPIKDRAMREPMGNGPNWRCTGFRRGQGGVVDSRQHSAAGSGQGGRALEVAAMEMIDGCVYLAHRSVSDRGLDEWQADYFDLSVSVAIQRSSRGGRSSPLKRFEISRRCIGSLQVAPIRLALVCRLRTRRSIFAHSGQRYDPKLLSIGTCPV